MIQSFVFNDGKLVARDIAPEAMRESPPSAARVLWVDLEKATPEEISTILEKTFQFHPVAIEDCVSPDSLPKIENYDDYLFIVTQAVDFSRPENFNPTELNLFLGKDFLVTFHRAHLRSVQSAIERCIKATGVVARGPDRLAHMVLDLAVDNYQPVMDQLRKELDEIEESVLERDTDKEIIPRLLEVKREVSRLRTIIRPQREVFSQLAHGEAKLIRSLMLPYFRDLRDGLVRIDEAAAAYADQLLISFDLYLSKSDFQANEGIKALTALTALTLPATLIATWYGMNFEHMPELKSPYGYPTAFIVTAALTLVMWRWCKRRGWI
jgi:magnesium transporter